VGPQTTPAVSGVDERGVGPPVRTSRAMTVRIAAGGIEKDVERARKMTADAITKQQLAAAESRRVARELRGAGLSVADTARVMDISKGRVAQLTS